MLKKILSPEECATCRICCGFDRDDIWEIPLFDQFEKAYIESVMAPPPAIEGNNEIYHFEMHFDKGDISYCPALTDKGCILKNRKPYDCAVWPFRVMKLKTGKRAITVSPVCPAIMKRSLGELMSFMDEDNFRQKLMFYADRHPGMVKDYIKDYPILYIEE